jgi:RHS repeat-associated protein
LRSRETVALEAITDAYRYDGYGNTVATTGSSTNAWRYQGRLDISPSAVPLYDAGARFYAPSLGVFTQADTVAGTAQDPASLNRYLYTAANPATLIDPDGHAYCGPDGILCAAHPTSSQPAARARHHAPAHHHAPPRRRLSGELDAIGHDRGRTILRHTQASHSRTIDRLVRAQAAAAQPKVVVVLGPASDVSDRNRARGDAAAATVERRRDHDPERHVASRSRSSHGRFRHRLPRPWQRLTVALQLISCAGRAGRTGG